MRSDDVDVRRRAVLAIAELPGDEATAALAAALEDPDPHVRRPAALAAGRRGTTAAVPVLVAMVAEGANDVEAAEVLGTLALDPGRGERILNALAGELAADSPVRIRVAQALAELPGTLAHDLLRQLADDEDRAVALIAAALVPDERPHA
jgi:HEAT repeat protein